MRASRTAACGRSCATAPTWRSASPRCRSVQVVAALRLHPQPCCLLPAADHPPLPPPATQPTANRPPANHPLILRRRRSPPSSASPRAPRCCCSTATAARPRRWRARSLSAALAACLSSRREPAAPAAPAVLFPLLACSFACRRAGPASSFPPLPSIPPSHPPLQGGFAGWVSSKLRIKPASTVSRVEVLAPGYFGTGSTFSSPAARQLPSGSRSTSGVVTTSSNRRALPSSTGGSQ